MHKQDLINTKWDTTSWTTSQKKSWVNMYYAKPKCAVSAFFNTSDKYFYVSGDAGGLYVFSYDNRITFDSSEFKTKTYTDAFPESETEKHTEQRRILTLDNMKTLDDMVNGKSEAMIPPTLAEQLAKARFDEAAKETGGGSCNYYKVKVEHPTTLLAPYEVECNDLIESLSLTFAEANIYKELFRTANERTRSNGKQGSTPTRAAEKVLFFALRNAIHNDVNIEEFLSELNLK